MFATANYAEERGKCEQMLQKFSVLSMNPEDPPQKKYLEMIAEVNAQQRTSFPISLDDVSSFFGESSELLSNILRNTRRYVELFSEAIDNLLPARSNRISDDDDVIDVLVSQRIQQVAAGEQVDLKTIFPRELLRRFSVTFTPLSHMKPHAIREIRASSVGATVFLRGIVTRTTDVRPQMVVATYSCERCGFETYQEVISRTFRMIDNCQSERCTSDKTPGRLTLQTRGSKFIPFQEIHIQELSNQVPIGHIPRSMAIHAFGEQTRVANPGDIIHVSGIFLPVPFTSSPRQFRAGLVSDTYLHAQFLERVKKNYDEYLMTPELLDQVDTLRQDGQIYSRLARSIAPEIYGMENVKKALLLMLVGGVTRQLHDGIRIRGDINVCLVGDPGVAKSQLLKYISVVAPRGVYTTGKGSSGVGLTAAVVRDQLTGEMILEGGALVLADNGICCIDEFDKMDDSDRTAIHEVMEQQSVSISKAGINTSLNARTAILAAANPVHGRYNDRLSMLQNINLPAALLSRFDLMFLLLDVPNADADMRLAQHITTVHATSRHPELDFIPVTADILRAYVAQARLVEPVVPDTIESRSLIDYIVRAYVGLRGREANKRGGGGDSGFGDAPRRTADEDNLDMTYTTPRTLLGILRLSQALARMRFSPVIGQGDVDEAIRLMHSSKESLFTRMRGGQEGGASAGRDSLTAIYEIIKDVAIEHPDLHCDVQQARDIALSRGYTADNFDECLRIYEDNGIWILDSARTGLTFIGPE